MGLTGSEGASACFAFSHMLNFTPIQMEVQRAGALREAIGARVCLLGRDRSVYLYKTFALPDDWEEGNLQV
jgi:anaphase-promoting complex subunit 4